MANRSLLFAFTAAVVSHSLTGFLVAAEPRPGLPPLPAELAPFFQPPAEFAKDFREYATPLKFYDDRTVAGPEDWPARREEILTTWHALMGPWPPLIERPKIEYLEQARREDFTQHRVRIETAPDWTSDGYLLVPDGDGPFPAALVVYYEPETGVGANDKLLRRNDQSPGTQPYAGIQCANLCVHGALFEGPAPVDCEIISWIETTAPFLAFDSSAALMKA